VMIMVVIFSAVLMLGALLAAAAEASTNDTATRAEISTQAQAAAEAGLSQAEAAIANPANASSLPCSVQGTVPATSTGGTDTYQATITYYASQSGGVPQGAPIPCSSPPTVQSAGAALISSTGTSQIGIQTSKQVIDEVVSITPQILGGYAIYSGGNLKLTNYTSLGGGPATAVAGNIFVNGNLDDCDSYAEIQGDAVITGSSSLTDSCTITGNLWSGNGVSVTGSYVDLEGNAYVTGNLTFTNPGYPVPQFHQNAYVTGSITDVSGAPISANIAGQAVSGATVTNPPNPGMPQIAWNQQQWINAGYEVVRYVVSNPTTSACGTYSPTIDPKTGLPPYSETSGVYRKLFYPNGAQEPISQAPPMVLYTNCPIQLYDAGSGGSGSGSTSSFHLVIPIDNNLAIVDTACTASSSPINCIKATNSVTFSSADGASHELILLVPWTSGRTCPAWPPTPTTADIEMDTQATIASPLLALVYTQCYAAFSNSTSFSGELIGGGLALANNFTLVGHPNMLIPGFSNTVQLNVVARYNINQAA